MRIEQFREALDTQYMQLKEHTLEKKCSRYNCVKRMNHEINDGAVAIIAEVSIIIDHSDSRNVTNMVVSVPDSHLNRKIENAVKSIFEKWGMNNLYYNGIPQYKNAHSIS